mmetsp:Transcript_8173/g.13238  ORF Transcript_8173/g.13238 Transcript_8173/m.13238 type:complete len:209 (-) Transcript_8173:623-1249(-)
MLNAISLLSHSSYRFLDSYRLFLLFRKFSSSSYLRSFFAAQASSLPVKSSNVFRLMILPPFILTSSISKTRSAPGGMLQYFFPLVAFTPFSPYARALCTWSSDRSPRDIRGIAFSQPCITLSLPSTNSKASGPANGSPSPLLSSSSVLVSRVLSNRAPVAASAPMKCTPILSPFFGWNPLPRLFTSNLNPELAFRSSSPFSPASFLAC